MNGKAQVSIEFLIVVVLLVSLLLFSLSIYGEKRQGLTLSQENHEAKTIADKLAENINGIVVVGNGAETTIRLKQIEGFAPSIAGNAARVSWRNNFVDSALLTNNVTVNNLALGKELKIENINGEIVIDFA